MKNTAPSHLLVLLAASFLTCSVAYAQSNQTWVGSGGLDASGTWDEATSPDWSGGTVWQDGNNGVFGTGTGTVNVDAQGGGVPVTFNTIEFNNQATGAGYTFTGDDLISEEGGTVIQVDAGNTANNTFENQIDVSLNGHSQGDQSNFSNASTSTLTLGNINVENFNGFPPANQYLSFNQAAGGTMVLAGAITNSGGGVTTPGLLFGPNPPSSTAGTYEITGSIANGLEINTFGSLTLLLGTGNLGNQVINIIGNDYTTPTRILTVGAQTITNNIQNQNDKADIFGGSTADVSNFNGTINPYATVSLVTATGGRVNFNGVLGNQIGLGVTTSGDGVIALNSTTGNTYGLSYAFNPGNPYGQGNVAGNLGAALTLITNTSGTAFGNNITATVNLLAHSALGGSGISTQKIIVTDATSVLAPGDSGIYGGTAGMATLHLTGGVAATSGLTMDFKLGAPGASDALDLGAGDFTLSGTVTVNLSDFGGLELGTVYTLASGTGTWSDARATFVLNGPAGDVVTSNFDSVNDRFTVEIAAPEPSTYALMGLGGLVLVWRMRRKAGLLS